MLAKWLGAIGTLGLACGALAVPACGGDDTAAAGGPGDSGPDSTTNSGSGSDSGNSSSSSSGSGSDSGNSSSSSGSGEGGPDGASVACSVDASGLDEASVAAGFQAVWTLYRCWGCHQKTSDTVDDAGNGIVLSGNNNGLGDSGTIFPPNLTGDPSTGLGCWTNQQIQDALLNGKDIEGGALCPQMPVFGHALTTADGGPKSGTPMDAGTAQEIIDFLRSLKPVVNKVMDTTCSTADAGSQRATDGSADAPAGDAGME